jgi:ferredoxin, 2Fe-2S
MPEIIIGNMNRVRVPFTETTRPLLYHIQRNYIDWMHACGGKGRCTTCKVIIKEGKQHFQPLTRAEEQYQKQGLLLENERLACQAIVTGTVVVFVPDENKLPHVEYAE